MVQPAPSEQPGEVAEGGGRLVGTNRFCVPFFFFLFFNHKLLEKWVFILSAPKEMRKKKCSCMKPFLHVLTAAEGM